MCLSWCCLIFPSHVHARLLSFAHNLICVVIIFCCDVYWSLQLRMSAQCWRWLSQIEAGQFSWCAPLCMLITQMSCWKCLHLQEFSPWLVNVLTPVHTKTQNVQVWTGSWARTLYTLGCEYNPRSTWRETSSLTSASFDSILYHDAFQSSLACEVIRLDPAWRLL